jgi:two-component sensor histidine kinase
MSEHHTDHLLAARVRELEAEVAQKTALFREIDHRVKNNLQLISSLMLLQSRRITDDTARQALRSMLERVTAVATVHRRLFQGDDPQRFDVADFVGELTGDLAMSAGRDDITITTDLEHVAIAASAAAPFALIVNELVGNALKHAFPGRPGAVAVRVAADADECILTVADNGLGMDGASGGFGATIVQLLCRQLHAVQETQTGAAGTRITLRLPRGEG